MRTTVTIDDALYRRALEVADPATDKADLFREAVQMFVRVQTARRLAAQWTCPISHAARWSQTCPNERRAA